MRIYFIVKAIARLVCHTFFNKIKVVGQERLPLYGPAIFVANHHNKFVDACIIMACIPRPVRFLVATSSLKSIVIGTAAKLANAIGVTRAQDNKLEGHGKIIGILKKDEYNEYLLRNYIEDEEIASMTNKHINDAFNTIVPSTVNLYCILIGTQDCNFAAQTKLGDRIQYKQNVLMIQQYISSNIIICSYFARNSIDFTITKEYEFCIYPKINQVEVYENVNQALSNGESVCIFPEGGSHDQPGLLPLKSGVAIMALSAASIGVEDILIMPCGIHYQNRHKFGSNAVIEIGKPIRVTENDVMLFKSNSQTVIIDSLMKQIKTNLENCVVCANDAKLLKAIDLAAKIYVPDRDKVSTENDYNLQSIFTKLFTIMKDDTEMVELKKSLFDYSDLLEYNGISDTEVHTMNMDGELALYYLCLSSFWLIILVIINFPTAILIVPIRSILNRMAEKYKIECKAKSIVKVTGIDVVASYKIIWILAVMPISYIVLSAAIAYCFFTNLTTYIILFITILLVLPITTYYSLNLQQKIYPLVRYITCCYRVFISAVSYWNNSEVSFIEDRASTQLKLREFVAKKLFWDDLNYDSETTKKLLALKYDLEQIIPFMVIEADTRRLKRTRHAQYKPLMNMRIYSREEII